MISAVKKSVTTKIKDGMAKSLSEESEDLKNMAEMWEKDK